MQFYGNFPAIPHILPSGGDMFAVFNMISDDQWGGPPVGNSTMIIIHLDIWPQD